MDMDSRMELDCGSKGWGNRGAREETTGVEVGVGWVDLGSI